MSPTSSVFIIDFTQGQCCRGHWRHPVLVGSDRPQAPGSFRQNERAFADAMMSHFLLLCRHAGVDAKRVSTGAPDRYQVAGAAGQEPIRGG